MNLNGNGPKNDSNPKRGSWYGLTIKTEKRRHSVGNSWVYRLGVGDVFGVRCVPGFNTGCSCHKDGIGHETKILRREKYHRAWYLGIRYCDEDDWRQESNFLPVKYLTQYATKDYTSIRGVLPFP